MTLCQKGSVATTETPVNYILCCCILIDYYFTLAKQIWWILFVELCLERKETIYISKFEFTGFARHIVASPFNLFFYWKFLIALIVFHRILCKMTFQSHIIVCILRRPIFGNRKNGRQPIRKKETWLLCINIAITRQNFFSNLYSARHRIDKQQLPLHMTSYTKCPNNQYNIIDPPYAITPCCL